MVGVDVRRAPLDLGCRKGGAGPLQRAVDGRHARFEELGDLGRLPTQDLAQDQDCSLPRRQMLQRGHERQANGLASCRDLARVILGGEHPLVGDGRHPGVLGQHLPEEVLLGRRRRTQLHGPGSPLTTPQHVETHVGGDAVQPRPHARASLEGVGGAPRPYERLLHGVVGLEGRAEHAVAVPGQLSAVLLELV